MVLIKCSMGRGRPCLQLRLPSGTPRILALCGLGGIGKTSLAKEYAFHKKNNYQLVWLINVSGDIYHQFFELLSTIFRNSKELGILDDASIKINELSSNEIIQKTLEHLRKIPKWLLIFDDVIDEHELQNLLPIQHTEFNHILVTSRKTDFQKLPILKMGILEREHAIALLKCLTPQAFTTYNKLESDIIFFTQSFNNNEEKLVSDEDFELNILATLLGDLRLALIQATNYIRNTKIRISDYIKLFVENRKALWEKETKETPLDYSSPVQSAWTLSLAKIQNACPMAKHFFNYIAFLATTDVPYFFIKDLLKISDIEMRDLISNTLMYSMIDYDSSRQYFSLHVLVQNVILDSISENDKKEYLIKIINVCISWFGVSVNRLDVEVRVNKILFNHVKTIIENIKNINFTHDSLVLLLVNMGNYYLKELSDPKNSYFCYHQALDTLNSSCPNNLELKADIYHGIGNALFNRQDYVDAATHYSKSLDFRPNSSDQQAKAISLHQLANTYSRRFLLTEALDSYQKALTINMEIYENQCNPYIANNLHEMSNIASLQNKHDDAIKLIQIAVEIKILFYQSKFHPDVAISIDMWGVVLHRAKKDKQAQGKYYEALEIYAEAYGYQHSDYKDVKSRLIISATATGGIQ